MTQLEIHEKEFPKSKVLVEGSSDYASRIDLAGLGHLTLAIEKLFAPNSPAMCLDIGANIGITSLIMDQYFENADIWAFEPHPKTFSQLRNNIERNAIGSNRIEIFGFGLSDKEGELLFRDIDQYNTGNSIILENTLAAAQNTIRVPIKRLDDLAELPTTIDLMKVDVEGFELDVLNGAKNVLTNTRVVLLEFNHWCFSSLAAVLPQDALRKICDLFEGVFVYDLRRKLFRRIVTDAEKWSFLHQNMVTFNVNDLLCTNDPNVINKLCE